MKRCAAMNAALLVLSPLVGCGFLTNESCQIPVTVRLVNDSDSTLTAELSMSASRIVPEGLFVSFGDDITIILAPGESSVFMRDWDDVQAIKINRVTQGIGIGDVYANGSSVYVAGVHFDCGDTIVFTFTVYTVPDPGVTVGFETEPRAL